MRRTLEMVLVLAAAAGCAPADPAATQASPSGTASGPPARFDFNMLREEPIDVSASCDGVAVPGVLVQVRKGITTPTAVGYVVWTGVTGPDGHARATIRIERFGTDSAEVTLNKSGYVGHWSDAAAQASLGSFGPSAQIIAPVDDLRALDVDLERRP
jgi:hypothetical protein